MRLISPQIAIYKKINSAKVIVITCYFYNEELRVKMHNLRVALYFQVYGNKFAQVFLRSVCLLCLIILLYKIKGYCNIFA